MKKKNFLPPNNLLPELDFYMTFVEAAQPILFACKDEDENLYICACHCSDASKCEWLIAQTSCDRLIELLTDKITIRDIFVMDHSEIYIATLYDRTSGPVLQQKAIAEIDPNILPTSGYYMEAEDDEFQEELTMLSEMAKRKEESNSTNYRESYSLFISVFPFQLSLSEFAPTIPQDNLSIDETQLCYSI